MVILIVDDSPLITVTLQSVFGTRRPGWEVRAFVDAVEANEALRSVQPDVILADRVMPELDGITLLENARTVCPRAVRILLTGNPPLGQPDAIEAVASKGMPAGELIALIESLHAFRTR